MQESCHWFVLHGLHSLLSYINQDHAYEWPKPQEVGPHTSIINQENVPTHMATDHSCGDKRTTDSPNLGDSSLSQGDKK